MQQKKALEVGQDAAGASAQESAANLATPYPPETRAKGWRFELDYEQIEQSDTWSIAAEVPMAQHALLMMWMVAWVQVPCGSFPNDEAVIRAKCRIPPAAWSKFRAVLMRGWWAATDGRLYHDTLVKRVMEMMSRRRSDADRQHAKRMREAVASQANHAPVTPASRVTPPVLTPESSTDNRQPNTGTKDKDPPKPPRKRGPSGSPIEIPDWMPGPEWDAFVEMRRAKGSRAPFTVAAAKGIIAELAKFREKGHDPAKVLQASVNAGWSGVFEPKTAPTEIRGVTVPSQAGPDPALVKIVEDAKRAVPPSAEVRERMKTLAGKGAAHA
jgi:hypothetical protein